MVADDVRQLAGRTSLATEEIVSVVQKNQLLVNAAITSIDSSREEAQEGLTLANQAGAVILEIREGAKKIVEAVGRFLQTAAVTRICGHGQDTLQAWVYRYVLEGPLRPSGMENA